MNTQNFIYALEIAKAGSISKAASNLYMAQPNLSKSIKDMEAEVGYTIFKRSASGIEPTEKGIEFLFHAQKILEQMEEIEKVARRTNSQNNVYKISIPRGSYIANGVTNMISDICNREHLEVTVNETNAINTIDNVANHDYNAGIIRFPLYEQDYFAATLKNNNLEGELIWEYEVLLVMSNKHPLASKENLCLEDLNDYVKIAHGDLELPYEKKMAKNKNNSEESDKVIYVYERGSQFDLLTNVPTTYMWVSPIPDSIINKNELIQRACKSDTRFRDVLIYRKDYRKNEYDQLFEKKLYESKVEVSSKTYI